jgi:hypothetical protein
MKDEVIISYTALILTGIYSKFQSFQVKLIIKGKLSLSKHNKKKKKNSF